MEKCEFCGVTEEDLSILLTGGMVETSRGQITLAYEGVPNVGDLCVGPVIDDIDTQIHFFTPVTKDVLEVGVLLDTDDFILDQLIDGTKCLAVEINAHIHDKDSSHEVR